MIARGARRAASSLAVGHTERFNPAVAAARPLLADPRFIEVHRLGTFPERSLDIDVVFDLMIHDLDVVLSLVQSEVESIEAVGVPVLTPTRRHRQRAAAVRERLHRQPDGQPHQPRPRAQDPLLPAGRVRVDRLRRAEGRGVAAGAGRRGRCRRSKAASVAGGERGAARSASSRTSSTRCATGGRPSVTGEEAGARWRWRSRLPSA